MCLFISFYVFQGVWKHCLESSSSRNTTIYRFSKDGVLIQESARGADAAERFDTSAFLSFLRSSDDDLFDEPAAANINSPREDKVSLSDTITCPKAVPVMHL